MQAEPLLHWQKPIEEYVGFISQYVALGAVGFRFAAVGRRAAAAGADSAEGAMYADALRLAATVGLAGATVQAVMLELSLPKSAARAHLSIPELLTQKLPAGAQVVLLALALVGLLMAAANKNFGWRLALVGLVGAPLTAILAGEFARLINPIHRVAGGLWLGTLFIIVVAGIGTVMRHEAVRERRGAIVADMINGFSPLALTGAGLLVFSGISTAWRHLNPFSSLWTTPYGYALIVKLLLVQVVFAFGWWNWKRVRPALGPEGSIPMIRRSSRAELTVAALVLVASAIVVSLPSPKPPKPPGVKLSAAG